MGRSGKMRKRILTSILILLVLMLLPMQTLAVESAGTEMSTAAKTVADQIAALPTLEEIQCKSLEDQSQDYMQVQSAYTAYEQLPEDQKALLPPAEEVFKPYFDYFNSLVQPALIDSGSCGSKLSYTLDNDGTLTITGSGTMTSNPWRNYAKYVTKVVMKGGTNLTSYAFERLSNLTEVSLPATLTTIDTYAFYKCTSLTTVTIPAKVSSIAGSAFAECSSLMSIQVDASNPTYESVDGILFTEDGATLLSYPGGRSGAYQIPYGVTTLGENAFYRAAGLTDVSFPASLTTIGAYAFYGSGLVDVSVPDTVTTMEEEVFGFCESLTRVKLPKNITSIPEYMFFSCENLESVQMPAAITAVSGYAFWGCAKLASIDLTDTPTSIGERAFYGCDNLAKIVIPESVTYLGNSALASCDNMNTIIFEGDAPKLGNYCFEKTPAVCFYSLRKEGWTDVVNNYNTYSFDFEWQPYLDTAHNHAFNYNHKCACGAYGGSCGTYMNWLFDSGNGTLYIYGRDTMTNYSSGGAPWYNLTGSIKRIVVQEDITSIGDYAFYSCNRAEEISLPERISAIGKSAFRNCSALKELVIPTTVRKIGEYAFYNSGLRSITLPSLTTLGSYALYNSYLTDVYYASTQSSWDNLKYTLPSSVRLHVSCTDEASHWTITNTGDNCRTGGYVTETCRCTNAYSRRIQLPAPTATTNHVWSGYTCTVCGITGGTHGTNMTWTVDIFGTLTVYGEGAMQDCSTNYGGPWYRYYDKITGLVVEEGVTAIGSNAFYKASNLTTVTLPKSLTSVGGWAFAQANNIEKVNITDLTAWIGIDFLNVPTSNPLYSYADLYVNGQKIVDLVIPGDVTTVKDYTFAGCSSLQTVTFPEGVTEIGEGAFQSCSQITDISLPSTLTTLDYEAFYRCYALRTVTIPGSVSRVGSDAFRDCRALKHVVVEEGVTELASGAFHDCKGIVSVVLPASLKTFGSNAFGNSTATHLLYCGTQSQWNSIYSRPFTSGSVTKHYAAEGDEVKLTNLCTGMSCYCELCDAVLFAQEYEGSSHNLVDYVCTKCGYVADLSSGTCGENLSWALSADGTLTITGTGPMADYLQTDTTAPWQKDYSAKVKKVVLRDGVTSIGSWAFSGCSALTEVEISDSVETIGAGAFSGCSALKSITIPENVTKIQAEAFRDCSGLSALELPKTVETIGSSAFSGCTGLRYVVLPAGLASIGNEAFAGCEDLWHVFYAGTEEDKEAIVYEGSGHDTIQGAVWHCETITAAVTSPNEIVCLEKILHVCTICQEEVRISYPDGTHTWKNATCISPRTCAVCGATEGSNNLNLHDYQNNVCTLCGVHINSLEAQWPYAGRAFKMSQTYNGTKYYADAAEDPSIEGHMWLHAVTYGSGQRIYLSPNMAKPGAYNAYVLMGSTKYYLNHIYTDYVALATYTYTDWVILNSWNGKAGLYLADADNTYGTYVPCVSSESLFYWDLVTSGSAATIIFDSEHTTHVYEKEEIVPTCTAEGYTLNRCKCGMEYKTDIQGKIPHKYTHKTQWAEDYSSAKMTLICSICAENSTHDAVVEESVITPVTCTADGEKLFTATVSLPGQMSITATEQVTIPTTGHAYVNGVCVNCGEIEDPCHAGHDFGRWSIITEASCTENGLQTRKCSRCDHFEEETILAPGHDYAAAVTEPNCTEKGFTTYTCSVCGDSYTDDEVNALGHKPVADEAMEPTCTQPGKTAGEHCSVCGEVLIAQQEVSAKGHTEVVDEAVEATCTESGLTEGKHCAVCDEVLSAQQKVSAKGHTEVVDNAVEATCTATGLTAGKHCSVCDEVLVKQQVRPAKGHSYITTVIKPTCTDQGYTEYLCDLCADSYVGNEEAALGHNPVVDEAVKPTCTQPGKTAGEHCDRCQEVLIAQTDLNALGHTEVPIPGYEASCTAEGLTEGKYCSVCDEILIKQEIIPSTGHSYGYTLEQTPTLTEEGTVKGSCACGDEYTVTMPKLDTESYEFIVITEPTQTETGTGVYIWNDEICGTIRIEVILEKLPILYGDVNDDGKVNTKDRIILTRYLANWEGYEELPHKG